MRKPSSPKTALGPRIVPVFFMLNGLLFAVIGIVGAVLAARNVLQTWAMRHWTETPCRIVSAEVAERRDGYALTVRYTYRAGGKTYTGVRYSLKNEYTAKSIAAIDRRKKEFSPGSKNHCYVDPTNPACAVLRRPRLGIALLTFACILIFPLFGLGFAVLGWRVLRAGNRAEAEPPEPTTVGRIPAPDENGKKRDPWNTNAIMSMLFGGVFFAVGLGMLYPLGIRPILRVRAAKHWTPIRAVVTKSEVKTHTENDPPTYSVYIAYRYTIDGREYLGDRYSFFSGSSSGYKSKAEVVEAHPPGSAITVYVNPADPSESVIRRDLGLNLLWMLLPLAFMLVGLGVMIDGLRRKSGKSLDPVQSHHQVVHLEGKSRVFKAAFTALFTLVWSAVVLLLVKSDAPLPFPIVFGGFGLLLLGATLHALLALANPRANVEIHPGDIRPGAEVSLRWWLLGRTDRIRRFRITLRGLTVTTQSSNRRVKTPFFEEVLLDTASHREMARGNIPFRIPDDAPPSRPGAQDGIEWQIAIHGEIPRWPDLEQELPFLVYPPSRPAAPPGA